MKRLPRAFVSVALWAAAIACPAGEPTGASAPSPSETASNPLLAPPAPPPPLPTHPRSVSATTARHLAEAVPKFTPADQAQPPTSSAAAPREPAEDRPQNAIVRLPSYVVQAERVPDFKPREMLTPEGKVALAEKRHSGLRLGSISLLNDKVATAMLDEEDALERKREMAELYGLAATGNPATDKPLRDSLEEVFVRTSSWTDTGGSFQQQRR